MNGSPSSSFHTWRSLLGRFLGGLNLSGRWSEFSFTAVRVMVRGRMVRSEGIVPVSFPSQGNLGAVKPIEESVVIATDARGRTVAVTRTDRSGVYRFNLKPGTYTISAPGLGLNRSVQVRRDEARSFDFIETAA